MEFLPYLWTAVYTLYRSKWDHNNSLFLCYLISSMLIPDICTTHLSINMSIYEHQHSNLHSKDHLMLRIIILNHDRSGVLVPMQSSNLLVLFFWNTSNFQLLQSMNWTKQSNILHIWVCPRIYFGIMTMSKILMWCNHFFHAFCTFNQKQSMHSRASSNVWSGIFSKSYFSVNDRRSMW